MKAGVVGWPIEHSKSPIIHNFWLKQLAMTGSYEKYAVAPAALVDFINAMPAQGLGGVNITIPHKQSVYLWLGDRVSPEARCVGAVNTLVCRQGAYYGYNTDVAGFLEPLGNLVLAGKKACVLGAGGAARAVVEALQQCQIGHIAIVNRDTAKAAAALAQLAIPNTVYNWQDAIAALAGSSLLINTTSLGMAGQPPLELDLTPLPATATVYDIVYAPLKTELLRRATERGLATIDGLHMLIGQAAVAFELMFGTRPPRDATCDAMLRERLLA